jgi:hypothetical protein
MDGPMLLKIGGTGLDTTSAASRFWNAGMGEPMGYNEQIGVANQRHRERLAAMNPSQRAIRKAGLTAIVIIVCAALWALMLAPYGMQIAAWIRG